MLKMNENETPKSTVKLPVEIAEPSFCENESEFYKIFVSQVKVASNGDPEEAMFFTMGIRILCHEYLALVLSGKMEPLTLSDEFVEREKKFFREVIHLENEMMQKAGVPLKEGRDGKVDIDIEELKRRVNGKTES